VKIPPGWWLIGLLFACHAATAQTESAPRRSVSYSTWLLEDDLVTARLVLPAAEAASLVGKAMPLLSSENLAKYVLKSVSVTAGGVPCEATDQGYDIGRIEALSLGLGLYGFEIIFRCPHAAALSLDNGLLFAEAPQHVDYARIERGGAHAGQLFTAAHHVLSIAREGELPAAGADRFLLLGAGHAWRSAEWLCAILGFFLLARTRRELGTVLVALAIGYAASLPLTSSGLLPDVGLLGAGMGFVVACIAALLVAQALRRRQTADRPVQAVARGACVLISGILIFSVAAAILHRPAAALLLVGFVIVGATLVAGVPARRAGGGSTLPIALLPALAGLIDGLVLPGDYERLGQWSELSLRNLAAFDAGAWLTVALMLAVFATMAKITFRRALKVGSRAEEFAPMAVDIAASVFAGFGSFWLLSRLY
jgi:hypothetical protein